MSEVHFVSDWIPIGAGSRDELNHAATKICEKWPGRYEFDIADSQEAEKPCRLRVRHRPCPSVAELAEVD